MQKNMTLKEQFLEQYKDYTLNNYLKYNYPFFIQYKDKMYNNDFIFFREVEDGLYLDGISEDLEYYTQFYQQKQKIVDKSIEIFRIYVNKFKLNKKLQEKLPPKGDKIKCKKI